MTSKLYDVLIIGGGPAGLSMAVLLARQAYSALILDSGSFRNAAAKHIHTVQGFDHVHPEEFRAKVRADLKARYPDIEYRPATIKQVRKLDGDAASGGAAFEAVDEDGTVFRGRKLGLGTGVRDMIEDQPEGYAECWGKGIFHCLFCDGFEERGVESAGIIATGFSGVPEVAKHGLGMAARLAKHVNVYTNGNSALESELRTGYKSKKFAYDGRVIAKLRLVGDGPQVEITFDDGTTKTEGWITNHPFVEQKAPFAEQLGLKLAKSGEIEVTPPFLETSLPGCFAAGDAASMLRSAGQALYMGGMAGVGMSGQLQRELDAIGEL